MQTKPDRTCCDNVMFTAAKHTAVNTTATKLQREEWKAIKVYSLKTDFIKKTPATMMHSLWVYFTKRFSILLGCFVCLMLNNHLLLRFLQSIE